MPGGAPKGNQNAVKEKRMITDALHRAATQNPEMLRKACIKLLEQAEGGCIASFREIADRLEGKPAQAINVGGQEDNPLLVAPAQQRPKLSEDEWLETHGIEHIEKAG